MTSIGRCTESADWEEGVITERNTSMRWLSDDGKCFLNSVQSRGGVGGTLSRLMRGSGQPKNPPFCGSFV